MTVTHLPNRSTIRALVATGTLVLLSACGFSHSGTTLPVRGGPQAVHPSPSSLAQGAPVASLPVTNAAPYPCDPAYGGGCTVSTAADGSQPIID